MKRRPGLFVFNFLLGCTQACGILVPQPGIEPVPSRWNRRVLTIALHWDHQGSPSEAIFIILAHLGFLDLGVLIFAFCALVENNIRSVQNEEQDHSPPQLQPCPGVPACVPWPVCSATSPLQVTPATPIRSAFLTHGSPWLTGWILGRCGTVVRQLRDLGLARRLSWSFLGSVVGRAPLACGAVFWYRLHFLPVCRNLPLSRAVHGFLPSSKRLSGVCPALCRGSAAPSLAVSVCPALCRGSAAPPKPQLSQCAVTFALPLLCVKFASCE